MKERDLLKVIFEDADAFRERSLRQTLDAVRHRRRARRTGQALATICLLALLTIWWLMPKREVAPAAVGAERTAQPTLQIVHTRGLSADLIAQSSSQSFVSVFTSSQSVVLVQTKSEAAQFAELRDEELLALVPGEAKLLVWHAPHEAELVLLTQSVGRP